jgi:octaprenyl-diphosphate synthase
MKTAVVTYEELRSYVSATKQLVDSELADFLSRLSKVKLCPMLEYALLSDGKRLRPVLTVLSAQSVGGSPEKIVRLALAFELLHTATLVHDDIIDEDSLRRGREPLYSRWSLSSAILSGDALIAMAINLAADYGSEIMKNVSNVGLELCDGEYVDVSLSLSEATEGEYLTKIKKKSASLFRAVTCCGAISAGGTPLEIEALSKFGEYFGMAYQVNDDLSDAIIENRISQDLKNGNVTLPFLYAYKNADSTVKSLLIDNFGNRRVTASVVDEIRSKMRKSGAFAYCQAKVKEYSRNAKESLEGLRESMFKGYLMQFPDYVSKPNA